MINLNGHEYTVEVKDGDNTEVKKDGEPIFSLSSENSIYNILEEIQRYEEQGARPLPRPANTGLELDGLVYDLKLSQDDFNGWDLKIYINEEPYEGVGENWTLTDILLRIYTIHQNTAISPNWF